MSDGVLIQFVCQVFNLMVVQIKVSQRFVCIVFVDSPHNSNEDHMELDFPISLSVQVGSLHAVLCFCFLELGIRSSVFTKFELNQVNLPLVWIQFLVFSKLLKFWVAGCYARGAHSTASWSSHLGMRIAQLV